jgi:hypothetical protein
MEVNLNPNELDTLSRMSILGSSYEPQVQIAETLAGHGFVESNGQGGFRITAEGRKYIRDTRFRV